MLGKLFIPRSRSSIYLWTSTLQELIFFQFVFLSGGCIDYRKNPRTAVLRALNPQEKKKIHHSFLSQEPQPAFPSHAVFSNSKKQSLLLYGADISPNPIQRGKPVHITYYFKPLQRFEHRWGIFLHLQASSPHKHYSNHDHQPIDGLYHSQRWKKDQIFKSTYTFTMPQDFPGPRALFYTGLWKGNKRMIISPSLSNDGKNRLLLAKVPVHGGELHRPIYTAYRLNTAPIIDGKLDDPIWQHVPSTGPLKTYNNKKARFRTEVRIAWDAQYLYVAFDCEDNDIWGTYKKQDDPLFKQENIELFIDANQNRKDYIELQVSPRGIIFDSFFKRYRFPKPWGNLDYASDMIAKVHIEGTLNKRTDRDRRWSVEMRLPLHKLGPAQHLPPKDGDEWLINMYRLERSKHTGAEDHAWSPVTLGKRGDYHRIDRFGTLRFSTQPLPTSSFSSSIPAHHSLFPKTQPTFKPMFHIHRKRPIPLIHKPHHLPHPTTKNSTSKPALPSSLVPPKKRKIYILQRATETKQMPRLRSLPTSQRSTTKSTKQGSTSVYKQGHSTSKPLR